MESPGRLAELLDERAYLADEGLATAAFLALRMGRPLFLEGEAGVGKTELARTLAAVLAAPLIRLQCYEGLDASQALYDWDFARQLLHLKAAEAARDHRRRRRLEAELYDRRFLIARPLLKAIETQPACCSSTRSTGPTTSSRRSCWRCSPTSRSPSPSSARSAPSAPPVVVLTSNRTREVHDALKRRCLYHWLEHPSFDREVAILRRRLPDVHRELAEQVAEATARLRDAGPGQAARRRRDARLGRGAADPRRAGPGPRRWPPRTLGAVLKYREDHEPAWSRSGDRCSAAARGELAPRDRARLSSATPGWSPS